MRSESILNAVEVVYPDLLTHINDRNIIKVNSLTARPVGGRFTFDCNGETATIEYQSELENLVFRINSSLKKITNGQHQTVTVSGSVSNGSASYDITPFTLVVEQGRSLNSRPHGCCRTMYYQNDDDLSKVEIYVPVGGTAVTSLYSYPLEAGVNSLDLTTYDGNPVAPPSGDFPIEIRLSYSHGDTPTYFGDLWRHSSDNLQEQTNYFIHMVNVPAGSDCGDSNSIAYGKIRFLDTDGCYKTFLGRVTAMKYSLKQDEYINNTLVMDNPSSLLTDVSQEMTLVFGDIKHNAYLYDIAYSPSIQYLNGYGEWKDAILADSNLNETNGDEMDEVTIKIKVLA